MSWMNNLRIGNRLVLEFGLVLVLAVGLGAFLLQRLGAMEGDWEQFEKVTAARSAGASAGVAQLSNAIHHFKNFVLRGGDYAQKFEADLAGLEQVVVRYRGTGALSPQEESSLRAVTDGVQQYRKAMARLVELRAAGAAIAELDQAVAGADKPVAAAFDQLQEINRQAMAATSARLSARLSSSRAWGLGLMVLMTALGAGIALLSARAITRPLGRAVEVAQRVAAGDLTSAIEVTHHDETGLLLQALADMNGSLAETVGQVREGSSAVSRATREIALGNTELAQRTTEQASGLEETASSMEELTATVKQNAENARQADRLAANATLVAGKVECVVEEAVMAMASISEASRKISEIIGVIDEIAFQTNILALNAAVEAARAGDHGRGFAVVAAEVRSLSQRTTTSAREVKALISESVNAVGSGSKLVGEAGAAIVEVRHSIAQVAELVNRFSVATTEQSQGIDQVGQALMQLEQVTQQNAAMVETSAASAEELDAQAERLARSVAVFTVAADGGGPDEPASAERLPPPLRPALADA
jgi:methyl-accepting chemotaxis protein